MERTVGRRSLPAPALHPSAEQLKAAYAINEPLRALLPDGTIAAPKGLWRLASNQQQWDIEIAQIYGISASFIEALSA